MLRKNHFLFALVMSFSASAFALVGGPFDNGDYSQLLDDSAVYQASFTMRNGLGFAQFGSNVSLGASTSSGGSGSASTTNNSIGSILDRSVIYYKGVTYFGMATGMVDMERKTIMGITNGTPNASLSTSTASSTSGSSTGAVTSTVVSNNDLGFTCNTEWNGTIKESSNLLTFNGSGTLTILNPDLNTQIYSAISNLVAAIPAAATATSTAVITVGNNSVVNQIINAIGTLSTLSTSASVSNAAIPSAETVYENSETVPMNVTGSRKFFLSTR